MGAAIAWERGAEVGGKRDRKRFFIVIFQMVEMKMSDFVGLSLRSGLTGLMAFNRSCLTEHGFGIDFDFVPD